MGSLSSVTFYLFGTTSDGYLIIFKWQALDRNQRVVDILSLPVALPETTRPAGR
jgi:hypothetical protein